MTNRDLKNKIGLAHCLEAKIQLDEGKADNGTGFLEGYLAVYNNIDNVGDRIMPGAFAKSIKARVAAGQVPLMAIHFAYGGDLMQMAGVITKAKEDDYGLWIHADYLEDDDSQKVRSKIQAAKNKGFAMGLSVGYRCIRYDISEEDGKTIYNLRELELREGTVTVRPCNELAGLTNSKSIPPDDLGRDDLEDMLSAKLNVAKATISKAIDSAIGGGTDDDGKSSAAPPQNQPKPEEIADLTLIQAQILANEIYLERIQF